MRTFAQKKQQHPGQPHAKWLKKTLGQCVPFQTLLGRQRLKQHQHHGVEQRTAHHLEHQIEAAQINYLHILVVGPQPDKPVEQHPAERRTGQQSEGVQNTKPFEGSARSQHFHHHRHQIGESQHITQES